MVRSPEEVDAWIDRMLEGINPEPIPPEDEAARLALQLEALQQFALDAAEEKFPGYERQVKRISRRLAKLCPSLELEMAG